jgi:RNA polymerase sigma-70 factor (ECF subfamily)
MDEHLSQIATMWTVVRKAHEGHAETTTEAQQQLVERYSPAIYRYLLASVRDPDVASDLFQEFALRLVRGDFRRADPQRGRFRDFLKTTLYHLIVDHQRRGRRRGASLEPALEPAAQEQSLVESDREFIASWRAELLNQAWQALEEFENRTGQVLYTVLRYRTDHADERSEQMAARLSETLGKPVTAGWVRKRLLLARDKLADLLLDEVARYLGASELEEVTQELIEVGLLEYCRPALERRGAQKQMS